MVDTCIEDISLKDFDGLVIPGGPGSFRIMPNNPYIDAIINYFNDEHKLVSAICAAPHLIGRLGLLKTAILRSIQALKANVLVEIT